GLDNITLLTHSTPYKKLKFLDSRKSIVIRLKLKEINRKILLSVKYSNSTPNSSLYKVSKIFLKY
ncbi:hypothetical protein K469DRAFT_602751, partial [Zopfia rhizophila CBS 207.26]